MAAAETVARRRSTSRERDEIRRAKAEARAAWVCSVGELTAAHRERRALRHDAEADAADARKDEHGARWHRGRASGQRHRIDSVLGCEQRDVLELMCGTCGVVTERPAKCSARLLCRSCRNKAATRTRRRFSTARNAVMKAALQAGRLYGSKRFTEKLLTLTVPHAIQDARRRFELVKLGWPHFLRALNARWKRAGIKEHVYWYRVHEWTPGSDSFGHPHVHVWLLCDYIEQSWLADAWRAACAKVGHVWGDQPTILDIRQARGSDVAHEVIKYLTKDLMPGGDLVPPQVYAVMYQLYDGARRTQGSRGFLKHAGSDLAECPCGAVGCFQVHLLREGTAACAEARVRRDAALAAERDERAR